LELKVINSSSLIIIRRSDSFSSLWWRIKEEEGKRERKEILMKGRLRGQRDPFQAKEKKIVFRIKIPILLNLLHQPGNEKECQKKGPPCCCCYSHYLCLIGRKRRRGRCPVVVVVVMMISRGQKKVLLQLSPSLLMS
jgi:hypothetical protein